MKANSKKYEKFALCREMMQTPAVIKNFNPNAVKPYLSAVKKIGALFFTGEGSSRIFPSKLAMRALRQWGCMFPVATEGGRQSAEYDLKKYAVLGASNSGKTKELISLFKSLKSKKHPAMFGLTATADSMLEHLSTKTHVLGCGWENAVAATKSVAEQALFCHALAAGLAGKSAQLNNLSGAAGAVTKALEVAIPAAVIKACANATRIYFAGRNDGVAEELTLKTNEITRKPSAFFEGTYAVHGVEEVMDKTDVVIVVDPFREEIEKFRTCLEKGVGCKVIAISSKNQPVPTIKIPACKNFDTYVQLAAGWNLLVEIGLANKIDLDKPVRARKVGNEA